jgi:hypothetical protein
LKISLKSAALRYTQTQKLTLTFAMVLINRFQNLCRLSDNEAVQATRLQWESLLCKHKNFCKNLPF